jgi:hypothetical protein
VNDPVAALVEFLNEELDITVYGGSFQGSPPGGLVRASGGSAMTAGYRPTVDVRLDVRFYAATDFQAWAYERHATRLLHAIRNQETGHGTIRWCRIAGGPTQAVDTQTSWPMVLSSWQVYGDWLD